MKEVFRSSDAGRVGLYQSILEDAGIGTFVRNSSTQRTRALRPLSKLPPPMYGSGQGFSAADRRRLKAPTAPRAPTMRPALAGSGAGAARKVI